MLLLDNNGDIRIGNPTIPNAEVHSTVLEHERDKKIIVFKMKRIFPGLTNCPPNILTPSLLELLSLPFLELPTPFLCAIYSTPLLSILTSKPFKILNFFPFIMRNLTILNNRNKYKISFPPSTRGEGK